MDNNNNTNRRQSGSKSNSNPLKSTSMGSEVDLPNSPGLINEVDLSRLGTFNSYTCIYNRDMTNQVEDVKQEVELLRQETETSQLAISLY